MSWNKICVIGNLGRDPELRYTQQGKPVCSFSVATTEKWTGSDGNPHEETIWFKVVAWNKLAENASKYLSKGRQVYVEGRLKMSKWVDRDGKDLTEPEINASEIQFIGGAGEGNNSGGRNQYDQRRPGTDDHDQRVNPPADALPLGSTPTDEIPF